MTQPAGTKEKPEPVRPPLAQVALLFLRLGVTAFGGPAAHIAMMQTEVVEQRRWLSCEEFLDLLGAANLIPGPSSTELAIFIGYRLAGAAGLALAGVCFILPAFLMVLAIAWAYVRYGKLPQVGRALYGVKPVVIAILVQAIWNLGRTAIKHWALAVLGILAFVPSMLGWSPLFVLLGAGIAVGGWKWGQERTWANLQPLVILSAVLALFAVAPLLLGLAHWGGDGLGSVGSAGSVRSVGHAAQHAPPTPAGLFWVFLKVGSVIYGSGYVLLAFLKSDLVTQRGWLTQGQLLDAVSIGQVTPGPVFTTATFIGFVLGGPAGAVAATIGIFLPAFVFVALVGPFAKRFRSAPVTGAFLDGVNAAALALIAAVSLQLARAALVDPITIGIGIASLIALLWLRVNTTWLIAAGLMIGLIFGRV
jgi:chromate transporter